MDDAFTKPWQDVLEHFRVDPERGLAMEQVKSYQEKYGPNGELVKLLFHLIPKIVLVGPMIKKN